MQLYSMYMQIYETLCNYMQLYATMQLMQLYATILQQFCMQLYETMKHATYAT
jgi:hypothetical protein